jgi:hypothetical protein
MSDVFAVMQGLKTLKIESVESVAVEPEELFGDLDARRRSGDLADAVTTATVYYEASRERPGLLDRVNTATGERQAGYFNDGRFVDMA